MDEDGFESLSDTEISALHELELGIEHLHRAHGHLIAFHHGTGRVMDHLTAAETYLRDADYPDLADEIRDEYLPRGSSRDATLATVVGGRWSYDVLETYEEVFLDDILSFQEEVTETIAGGVRHVHERLQEGVLKRRSRRD